MLSIELCMGLWAVGAASSMNSQSTPLGPSGSSGSTLTSPGGGSRRSTRSRAEPGAFDRLAG